MAQATFVVKGDNIIEDLKVCLRECESVVHYEFETGAFYIYDFYDVLARSRFSITIVVDENKINEADQSIEIQCYLVGLRTLFSFRKKTKIKNLYDDICQCLRIKEQYKTSNLVIEV